MHAWMLRDRKARGHACARNMVGPRNPFQFKLSFSVINNLENDNIVSVIKNEGTLLDVHCIAR